MRFRSADALTPDHIGRRVTIRRRLTGGEVGDVVGILEELGDVVTIRDRQGQVQRIQVKDIVAARVIRPAR